MVFLPVQSSLQGTFTLSSGHPFISGKYLLPLLLGSTRKISALFCPDIQTEIPFWILYTSSRQELSCLESPVHNGQMNRGGRTDRHQAPGQEGGSEEQEGEEPSCSPGYRQACTWALACSESSPAACGWSWTPRWIWPALRPCTSPGPGREGWWTITWNDRARVNAGKHQ